MPFTSAKDIFDRMPQAFSPEAAAGVNAVIQFDLSGDGGAQYVVTIADQTCKVEAGTAPNPSMTLSMAASDYVAMTNGELNPMNAFMQGKVKVKGDMGLAMKVQSFFKRG